MITLFPITWSKKIKKYIRRRRTTKTILKRRKSHQKLSSLLFWKTWGIHR